MIFRLLFRQSLNSWRQLGLWYQIQNGLLWGFIILAASYYLQPFVQHWQEQYPRFYLLLVNGLLAYLIVGTYYYLTRRLVKQLPLSLLNSLPFSTEQLLQLFVYYLYRNWTWGWLIFLIFLTVEFRLGLWNAIWLLIFFPFLALAVIFFSLSTFFKLQKSNFFFLVQFLQLLLLILVSACLFLLPGWFLTAELFFAFALISSGILISPKIKVQLEQLYPLFSKLHLKKSFQIGTIKKRGPLLELIKRDFKLLWRNPVYRKSKIFVLVGIPILGHFYFSVYHAQAIHLFTLFVLFLTWWHYGQFFTPQYGQREPEWFFKTLHLHFFKYFSARFFVEFWYVLLILFLFSLTLHSEGIPLTEHWQLVAALCLASAFILFSMICFQIIFYDDPRTAGFTFHFSVLFFLVLSLWDYFLGPLISLVFLIFYGIKSYRFLRS